MGMTFKKFAETCGVTIPLSIIGRIAQHSATYLRELYEDGQKKRVGNLLRRAQKKFESIEFDKEKEEKF